MPWNLNCDKWLLPHTGTAGKKASYRKDAQMNELIRDSHGTRILVCADQGSLLASEKDANDFMSAAWERDATWVALPVSRLVGDFFQLSTRIAGDVIQKFVNHGLKLAIVGDISAWLAGSKALRDFVYEANRGETALFVNDLDELDRRIGAQVSG